MKIKTWLLLSYIIVMLLPLGAAYGLFAWINAYHQDRNVEEYFLKWTELQAILPIVEDPALYQFGIEYEQLDALTDAHTAIELYSKDGYLLYTSNPLRKTVQSLEAKENLYKNLYVFDQSYRSFTYRAPVFSAKELVGFYEVKLARAEWVDGVTNRTWFVVVLFVVFISGIFLVVVMLVNHKLNRRLAHLMRQMKIFAEHGTVEQIEQQNDEIGELAASFDEMRQQIEAARDNLAQEQREKAYMIASISHDLKTPLTSIRAYAESLGNEQNLPVSRQKEYQEVIIQKAHYMQQMLDDLLMYTLLQSPSYEIELVEVEGSEFFEMLVSDYEPLCLERKITLHTFCEVEGVYAVNPKQLLRVADNLMSNAMKHTKKNGEIILAAVSPQYVPEEIMPFATSLFSKQDGIYFIVQNSGIGIAPEALAFVFEPLYQTDTARTKKEDTGTGLGLSITKRMIEKHGGTVQIASEKNSGTCVVCWLPTTKRIGE